MARAWRSLVGEAEIAIFQLVGSSGCRPSGKPAAVPTRCPLGRERQPVALAERAVAASSGDRRSHSIGTSASNGNGALARPLHVVRLGPLPRADRRARVRARSGSPSVLLATSVERAEQAGRGGRPRGRIGLRPAISLMAMAWLRLSDVSSRIVDGAPALVLCNVQVSG